MGPLQVTTTRSVFGWPRGRENAGGYRSEDTGALLWDAETRRPVPARGSLRSGSGGFGLTFSLRFVVLGIGFASRRCDIICHCFLQRGENMHCGPEEAGGTVMGCVFTVLYRTGARCERRLHAPHRDGTETRKRMRDACAACHPR